MFKECENLQKNGLQIRDFQQLIGFAFERLPGVVPCKTRSLA